ncbi:Abi family protein [Pseudomonas marginalis]|nr:Abi family protein [Pseudomonas marginalis]WGT25886.1 Abi family protein [Pseudomonas marginalis]
MQSWLHTLTTIRNMCAHHSRLWNRELGIRPELPRKANFLWPGQLFQPGPHTRIFCSTLHSESLDASGEPPQSLGSTPASPDLRISGS